MINSKKGAAQMETVILKIEDPVKQSAQIERAAAKDLAHGRWRLLKEFFVL